MAKRAARRAKLHAIDSARIHNLVFDHTPANDRDQSYIRKIRPRSDNQRILMEAIDSKPLTVALGPAGTGKTYLAISAAVEALESGSVTRIVYVEGLRPATTKYPCVLLVIFRSSPVLSFLTET